MVAVLSFVSFEVCQRVTGHNETAAIDKLTQRDIIHFVPIDAEHDHLIVPPNPLLSASLETVFDDAVMCWPTSEFTSEGAFSNKTFSQGVRSIFACVVCYTVLADKTLHFSKSVFDIIRCRPFRIGFASVLALADLLEQILFNTEYHLVCSLELRMEMVRMDVCPTSYMINVISACAISVSNTLFYIMRLRVY